MSHDLLVQIPYWLKVTGFDREHNYDKNHEHAVQTYTHQMLRSKVENTNSAYIKLYLNSINIPGFKRQIDADPRQLSQVQTNSRRSRSK